MIQNLNLECFLCIYLSSAAQFEQKAMLTRHFPPFFFICHLLSPSPSLLPPPFLLASLDCCSLAPLFSHTSAPTPPPQTLLISSPRSEGSERWGSDWESNKRVEAVRPAGCDQHSHREESEEITCTSIKRQSNAATHKQHVCFQHEKCLWRHMRRSSQIKKKSRNIGVYPHSGISNRCYNKLFWAVADSVSNANKGLSFV